MRPEAGGAGEAYRAAAGEQPHESFALVLAGQERQRGAGRSGRDGRAGRAVHLGAFGGAVPLGPPGPPAGRAGLYLAAVDGVDGEQEVTGDELHGAGECGRVLAEVCGEGVPGRPLTWRATVVVMAVLLRSPVVRVHRFKPPKSVSCAVSGPSRPAAHCAVASGPGPLEGMQTAGDRTLNLRTVSTTARGPAPSETSQSREDCARHTFRLGGRGHTRGSDSTPMPPSIARIRCSRVATRRRCICGGTSRSTSRMTAATGPAVRPHDHPEPGGVPGIQLGQVEHQVADSVVDGRVQDRTGVRRAADVEAAPDDQLGVVAPDVHMRSP